MRALLLFLVLLVLPGIAHASSEPVIAPPGEWVAPVDLPVANPALADRPIQTLLVNAQSRYGTDHNDHFVEIAALIQNSQGLQAMGNIVLPWQPDQSDLIIHKVRILRGTTVIDLLAQGREFTVLRRENSLESAVLNGVLTAVMQADGLAVGDVLDIAYTLRQRAGALPLRGENMIAIPPGLPARQFHVRQIWPEGSPMRWRGTGLLEQARVRRTALGTELLLDLRDVEGPIPPEQAPPRFAVPNILQLSEYRDWAEVSADLAPHYARAATLAEDSPLRAQIARIAAASPDPGVRAMAALRLVQDELRYFAVMLGDGNYLPATADQTWTRRYGDCKGKTAVLLALLEGLGIEAEPVLVSAPIGDGLNERLPQMRLFNHVVVRARIGDVYYWLDGTRTGDRNLRDQASAPFQWGLPLRTAGAELEAVPYAPPAQAVTEINVTYDGSNGFDGPIPIHVETIFRGDLASAMHAGFSQVGREEFLRRYRNDASSLPGEDSEVVSADVRDDLEAGSFAVIIEARGRLAFQPAPGAASRRFRFDNDTISWTVDLDRRDGPQHDAPYSFALQDHVAGTETVILPQGGRGFTIEGTSFERVVAGVRVSRQLSLADGRAVARSDFARIEREVPAAVARAAVAEIERINDDEAYLRAPPGTGGRPRVAAVAPDASANELVESGYAKMGIGQVQSALEDFDRAIALQPDWSRPHANRGVALIHLNRFDEAERALQTAQRLDDEDFVVHQGLAYLALRRGRPEEAVPEFTRSIELDPDNPFSISMRIEAYEQLGRFDDALAGIDQVIADEPRHAYAYAQRARLLAHLGRQEEAVAAIDAAIERDPGNVGLAMAKGAMLSDFGRREEAQAAWRAALAMADAMPSGFVDAPLQRARLLALLERTDEALAIADAQLVRYPGMTRMLAVRCMIRVRANVALDRALRDCDEALEAEPEQDEAAQARGLVYLRTARWSDAIRDFDQLLRIQPESPAGFYGRAVARLRSGDDAGAASDFARARRLAYDIDTEFARLGLAVDPPPITTPVVDSAPAAQGARPAPAASPGA